MIQVVLDVESRVARDPAARKRKDDVSHAAMLMAHRQHQQKNTAYGTTQELLARLADRRQRAGNVAGAEHPTERQWRERLTLTDERAFVAHSIGLDIAALPVALWWFAKSISDLERVQAYRECIKAQLDEFEQQEKYEQLSRRKSQNSGQ